MSTTGADATKLKPCGFTRKELIELLEKHHNSVLYSNFFFKAKETIPDLFKEHKDAMLKHPLLDRCQECGCTIAEHLPTTKRDRDEVENPSNNGASGPREFFPEAWRGEEELPNARKKYETQSSNESQNAHNISTDSAMLAAVEKLVDHFDDGRKSGSVENYASDLINEQLIERDATLGELTEFMCRLIDASVDGRSTNEKAKFPIACTVCGSGGGKSTLCAAIEGMWKDKIKNTVNNHIREHCKLEELTSISSVFATFNSTCCYSNLDEGKRLSREASLGIRLLASRHGWSHKDTSAFLNDKRAVAPYKDIRLVDCLEKIVPESQSEALIVLIDEILRLEDDRVIHDILLELSMFQQRCLTSGKKVFVLVTSLSTKPPKSLTRATQRRVTPISLPPISPEGVLCHAKLFVELLKTRRKVDGFVHHIISEFCASGGLVKNMKRVTEYFSNPSAHLSNIPLENERLSYTWAKEVLYCSVFRIPLTAESLVDSSTSMLLQDLIDEHHVAVVGTTLSPDLMLNVLVRIPTHKLRSIALYGGNLTSNQQEHLGVIMDSLHDSRESDGSYAKPFEIALMRVLCLRLSLSPQASTIEELLPGCIGKFPQCSMKFQPTECLWVDVEKLTKKEVEKERAHGTMVYSSLSNEKAIEGFWYLLTPNKKRFTLFFQMKFWKYCSPAQVDEWETGIHKRAHDVFGMSAESYVPLFFTTSDSFKVSSALAMPKKATEKLLEPFGVCPMMLYAEERSKKGNN